MMDVQSPPRAEATHAAVPAARRRHTPRLTAVNYWIDLLLLVNFVGLLWVTGVNQFVIPAAGETAAARLWGRDPQWWRDLQFGVTATLALGVLLHLMLHWNWFCSITNTHVLGREPGRDNGARTLLGVGLLIALLHLLAGGLLLAVWSLETPPPSVG
jgi:hypothetical protein